MQITPVIGFEINMEDKELIGAVEETLEKEGLGHVSPYDVASHLFPQQSECLGKEHPHINGQFNLEILEGILSKKLRLLSAYGDSSPLEVKTERNNGTLFKVYKIRDNGN